MSVKIIANPEGEVFTLKNEDTGLGTIMLREVIDSKALFSNSINNFNTRKARVCFFSTTQELFEQVGLRAGQVIEGFIRRECSFLPFYDNQSPVINPSTGEEVLVKGRCYYQRYLYTPTFKEDIELDIDVASFLDDISSINEVEDPNLHPTTDAF